MFKDREFVIFDVETTGLSPFTGDRVVEVAALKIKDGTVIDQFHSLVNPEREISYGAFMVNGISQAMVDRAPVSKKVFPKLMGFFGDAIIVGHNIRFDLGFLRSELLLLEEKYPQELQAIDTVKMARGLLPGLSSYSLASVVEAIGVTEIQQHRALGDVHLTWEVFRRLSETALRKEIDDLKTILRLFGYGKA